MRRDVGFDLRAAFAARRVPQSNSVFGKRDASFGVRGEGDEGREPETDPEIEFVLETGELSPLGCRGYSKLVRGVLGGVVVC